jgi:hypothetical protein
MILTIYIGESVTVWTSIESHYIRQLWNATRPQSGYTEVLDIVSREVSDLCFRKKLSTVLRKTGKDDLMKFRCGSVLLKHWTKWWNERDRLCVGYPSQIISLDWGYNVLNNTLKYYWYSFSFHLGLYKKYAVKQKCLRVLWVLRLLWFQKCSRFMRSIKTFLRITLVIDFKNSRQTLL